MTWRGIEFEPEDFQADSAGWMERNSEWIPSLQANPAEFDRPASKIYFPLRGEAAPEWNIGREER
jgi:hypothetical protein